MIIKEIEEDHESKYIVKFCNKPLNVTVDSKCVRPKPPPVFVQEFKLLDSVEAFRSFRWRKGIVKRVISQKSYMVSFEAIKKQVKFDHSDLRLPMEWEDGVWKTKESPLTQGSVMNDADKMTDDDLLNDITATPVKQEQTQGNTSNEITLEPLTKGNDTTQEKMPEEPNTEDNSRKRKRGELEHTSELNETVLSSDRTPNAAADDERCQAKDATVVLPFVKKSPVW